MKRTINFGVIGCGLMGREFASAAARWMHLTDVDVVPRIIAAADTNPQMLGWFRENLPGLQIATGDYHELLASPDVEAIYCAVPHHLHETLYCEIIDAGKHLLGEKPFGIDQAANRRILAAVRKRPDLLVRCSSEFPFYPAVQHIATMIREQRFGTLIEVRAGFSHSSDLDPRKPINWKRRIATNGAYGCMGDLGMHVVHLPLRAGWRPQNVRALLSKIIRERPGPDGAMHPCETWDNALLACEASDGAQRFPMLLEMKRIAPGETNTWSIHISGTALSVEYTTRYPKSLRTLAYEPGGAQEWREQSLGSTSAYGTITGAIFEFGFSDSLLQMWAAFCDELARPGTMRQPFYCATPEETAWSHAIFSAALESERTGQVVTIDD